MTAAVRARKNHEALQLWALTVTFPAGGERREVVSSVDLELVAGSTLGIVGESGSGKSVTLRALMGLLPSSARVTSGSLTMSGTHIPLAGRGVRAARRRRLAMVFQDPLAALDPVMSIGDQIAEVPRRVFGESRRASRATALDLMRSVRIPDPERRASAYPHQLSGGQRQRAVIAMALACRPEILLCDEPTTALDVTIAAEILDLLSGLREESGLSMIFVSHDLAVVSSMADRIVVMRSGAGVEAGSTDAVLRNPERPYTRQLLDAVLELPASREVVRPIDPAVLPTSAARTPLRLAARNIDVTYGSASAAVRAVSVWTWRWGSDGSTASSVSQAPARPRWRRC
ncbi:ABC-type glutathione transport system ATPase component [Nakamurella sp. UYEF19]|uniref:ABC transporter ATP-binding protein n=1 Tax=Nakamurella sp. UYEF19 TaxID=1756392 RepID=UPI00339A34B2